MDFGVPKEVRPYEARVGLTVAGAYALVKAGHRVYVEREAGRAAGFTDEDYRKVGAEVVYTADEAFGRAQVVLKVARLTEAEYPHLIDGQTILSFLHLAVASKDLSEALKEANITAVAYEMIQKADGALPVLLPLSQVAGRMATTIAGKLMEVSQGGRGILLSGIPGVPSAEIIVVGGGVLGRSAAGAFLGLGAQVTVLDRKFSQLEEIDEMFGGRVNTLMSTAYNLERVLQFADVVVGAVLVPGKRAPVLLTREMIRGMKSRTVFIDFSIDQGGCSETSRPTNHYAPTYIEEDIIHYAVPSATAQVARTASHAQTNAALRYILTIGRLGISGALKKYGSLRRGTQVREGEVKV